MVETFKHRMFCLGLVNRTKLVGLPATECNCYKQSTYNLREARHTQRACRQALPSHRMLGIPVLKSCQDPEETSASKLNIHSRSYVAFSCSGMWSWSQNYRGPYRTSTIFLFFSWNFHLNVCHKMWVVKSFQINNGFFSGKIRVVNFSITQLGFLPPQKSELCNLLSTQLGNLTQKSELLIFQLKNSVLPQ